MRTAVKLYHVEEIIEAAGISRRTLRVYEEVGLLGPGIEEDGVWRYPQETLETVLRIQRLRHELGVNLAGVQVILEMRRKLEDLQQHLDEVVRFVQTDLRDEFEQYLRRQEKAVVPRPLSGPPAPRPDETD